MSWRELTELASHTPQAKALIAQAFAERLGEVEVETAFHRNWNGGWRCRATLSGRGVLEFVLLINDRAALLALPVPMPAGWRLRGVAASDASRWTASDDGEIASVDA